MNDDPVPAAHLRSPPRPARPRDAAITTGIGVPRSTVAGWLKRAPQVITIAPGLDASAGELRVRVAQLEMRVDRFDSVSKARRLVVFYVEEHNSRIPHSAFRGQTPDEMYFDKGVEVPAELEEARREARRKRLAANRAARCAVCA